MPSEILIRPGDCIEVMAALAAEGRMVQSIVTDPPYHLTANKKGGSGDKSVNLDSPAGRSRVTTGFMGKEWDGGNVAFRKETWELALALLPPGGHLVAFSGTRTYHRMAVAIEDAGFEIRDQLQWLYGTGFPKSVDVSKALDKAAGVQRETVGYDKLSAAKATKLRHNSHAMIGGFVNPSEVGRITAPATPEAQQWQGWGTALKPACEPIVLARKPLSGTVAATVLEHGTGALNIDACRVGTGGETFHTPQSTPANRKGVVGRDLGITNANDAKFKQAQADSIQRTEQLGRWPANVILSVPEDEYVFRSDVTPEQRSKLYRWLSENP